MTLNQVNYLNPGLMLVAAGIVRLIHVFLELPLNHKTFVGIGSHLRTVLAQA